jgi:hypothetical protein
VARQELFYAATPNPAGAADPRWAVVVDAAPAKVEITLPPESGDRHEALDNRHHGHGSADRAR